MATEELLVSVGRGVVVGGANTVVGMGGGEEEDEEEDFILLTQDLFGLFSSRDCAVRRA